MSCGSPPWTCSRGSFCSLSAGRTCVICKSYFPRRWLNGLNGEKCTFGVILFSDFVHFFHSGGVSHFLHVKVWEHWAVVDDLDNPIVADQNVKAFQVPVQESHTQVKVLQCYQYLLCKVYHIRHRVIAGLTRKLLPCIHSVKVWIKLVIWSRFVAFAWFFLFEIVVVDKGTFYATVVCQVFEFVLEWLLGRIDVNASDCLENHLYFHLVLAWIWIVFHIFSSSSVVYQRVLFLSCVFNFKNPWKTTSEIACICQLCYFTRLRVIECYASCYLIGIPNHIWVLEESMPFLLLRKKLPIIVWLYFN